MLSIVQGDWALGVGEGPGAGVMILIPHLCSVFLPILIGNNGDHGHDNRGER